MNWIDRGYIKDEFMFKAKNNKVYIWKIKDEENKQMEDKVFLLFRIFMLVFLIIMATAFLSMQFSFLKSIILYEVYVWMIIVFILIIKGDCPALYE